MAASEAKPAAFEPTLSVVTVVLNAKRDFVQTLNSVRSQTWPRIQYVVVDGVSKDGTLEVIESNAHVIDTWVSERDAGFYDAMNKGLSLSTGDYVVFMNAGDTFYDERSVELMFATEPDADVYYGDTVLTNDRYEITGPRDYKKLPEALTVKDFRYGSVVCHQAFVARRSLCPPYDLHFPGSADIDWSIKVLKQARRIVNVHRVLARYKVGGLSHRHRWRYMRERFWIGVRHYGFFTTVWDNLVMVFRFLVRGRVM